MSKPLATASAVDRHHRPQSCAVCLPTPNQVVHQPAQSSRSGPRVPAFKWDYEFSVSYFATVPWEDDSPSVLHAGLRENLRKIKREGDQTQRAFELFAQDRVKALIFFSNKVEDSGLKQSDTYLLLDEVVVGRLSECELEAKITEPQGAPSNPLVELRGRREVLQHGAAYHYLCVETLSQPLTTAILLETHQRLMRNLTHTEGTRRGQLIRAGAYRLGPVYAGTHTFPPWTTVPHAVEALFEECDIMRTSRDDGPRDPYSLAAKMCYDFVTIHPFEDGNGRMCRLLMNRVLLEYGLAFPVACGFGFHSRAKNHYLYSIQKARASGRPKHLSTIVLASVHATLASFFENQRVSRRPVHDASRIRAADEYASELIKEQQNNPQFAVPIFQAADDLSDASDLEAEK